MSAMMSGNRRLSRSDWSRRRGGFDDGRGRYRLRRPQWHFGRHLAHVRRTYIGVGRRWTAGSGRAETVAAIRSFVRRVLREEPTRSTLAALVGRELQPSVCKVCGGAQWRLRYARSEIRDELEGQFGYEYCPACDTLRPLVVPGKPLSSEGDVYAYRVPRASQLGSTPLKRLAWSYYSRCRTTAQDLIAALGRSKGTPIDVAGIERRIEGRRDSWHRLLALKQESVAVTEAWFLGRAVAPYVEYRGVQLGSAMTYEVYPAVSTVFLLEGKGEGGADV